GWHINTNSTMYYISLRAILFYLRWLPLVILATIAIRSAIYKRAAPRAINNADGYISAFLVFSLVSCLYSIDPMISLRRLASVILMYGAIFWGIWVFADEVGEKKVVLIVVNTAAVLFAMHILVAVINPAGSFPYLGRFEGWMINPGTVAGYAASFLPLVLYITLHKPSRRYWLLVAVIVFILIMSQTRTELFSASIGSLYFLFFAYPKRRLISLMFLTIVLVASFVWMQAGPKMFPQGSEFSWNKIVPGVSGQNISPDSTLSETIIDSLAGETKVDLEGEVSGESVVSRSQDTDDSLTDDSLTREGVVSISQDTDDSLNNVDMEVSNYQENPRIEHITSLSSRTEKWRIGLAYFLERPLQGFGFGTEDQLFDYHGVDELSYIRTGSYIHNSYLGLVLQVGLVGALLFYVPIGIFLLKEIQVSFSGQHDPLRTSLLAVVLTCMVAAVASSDLYAMGNVKTFPFWISIMLLVRYSYDSNAAKK
ncbi:MAG: O-antigen ligase family protein, partial [Chloroflexota bacterium]|nr:O-antigen ligase family protein [Chloroflexota bacterium]